MPEALEAPVVETEQVESPAEPVEGAEPTEQPEGESSSEPLRGSALWREVKSLSAEGKPLTRAQLSALNKVIHRSEALDSKYPEGLSAIEGRLQAVQQLVEDETVPFERAIEETLQERQYFRELDDLFTNGKAEFVDKMADASPEAFQNIAPAVFRKFSEVNPEGYSAYIAQTVVQHMNSAEMPLQFRILASFLPQLPDSPAKEQVLNAVEALYGWSENLKSLAAKPITTKAIGSSKPGGDDRESQLAQREMNASRVEWNTSVQREGIDLVLSEAAKVAGKVKLSDKEKQSVVSAVGEELEARLTADKRYGEAMRGYLQNGNRASYVQRIQSERKKLVPGAVRRAVDDVIAGRPKAQPKPQGQQKQAVQPLRNQPGTPQFRKIAGHPKTLNMQVDLNRTSNSMLLKKQAYVKGQKEAVQWA